MKNVLVFVILIVILSLGVWADNETDDKVVLDLSGTGIDMQTINIPCNTTRQCFDTLLSFKNNPDYYDVDIDPQYATCNLDFHLCQYPIANKQPFKLDLFWTLLILGAMGFLGFIIYMEYKKPKEKKRFQHPIIVAVILGTFICLVVLVLGGLGFIDQDWVKDNPWIFPAIIAMAFASTWVVIQYYKAPDIDKLKQIAIERMYKDFDADPYDNDGFRHYLVAYSFAKTKDDNQFFDKVVNFLLVGKSSQAALYLISISHIDGKPTRAQFNPSMEMVRKIFSKEVADSIDFDQYVRTQALIDDYVAPQQAPMQQPVHNQTQVNG